MSKENGTKIEKTAKEKKPAVARKSAKQTIAERGNKGILAVMAQVAFSLAGKNKFVGTGIEIASIDEKGKTTGEFEEPASQHATIYHIQRPGGEIDKLDEKGEVMKNLIAKAKSAHADLSAEEQNYSKNVQSFVKELLKLKQPTESKVSVLRGVTFA